MNLNKTARANLMYIAIVIGILMLLPIFNRLVSPPKSEKYRDKTAGAITSASNIGPSPSTFSITMGKI